MTKFLSLHIDSFLSPISVKYLGSNHSNSPYFVHDQQDASLYSIELEKIEDIDYIEVKNIMLNIKQLLDWGNY